MTRKPCAGFANCSPCPARSGTNRGWSRSLAPRRPRHDPRPQAILADLGRYVPDLRRRLVGQPGPGPIMAGLRRFHALFPRRYAAASLGSEAYAEPRASLIVQTPGDIG